RRRERRGGGPRRPGRADPARRAPGAGGPRGRDGAGRRRSALGHGGHARGDAAAPPGEGAVPRAVGAASSARRGRWRARASSTGSRSWRGSASRRRPAAGSRRWRPPASSPRPSSRRRTPASPSWARRWSGSPTRSGTGPAARQRGPGTGGVHRVLPGDDAVPDRDPDPRDRLAHAAGHHAGPRVLALLARGGAGPGGGHPGRRARLDRLALVPVGAAAGLSPLIVALVALKAGSVFLLPSRARAT